MKTEHKLIGALILAGGLGGVLYWRVSAANATYTTTPATSASADTGMPRVSVSAEDSEKVTKLEFTVPDKENKDKLVSCTLEKRGEDWVITKPSEAKAATADVKSLLGKLKDLKLTEVVDGHKDAYESFAVTDEKATHFVAYAGNDKLVDLYFGKGGRRGQAVRVAGKDGVYNVQGFDSGLMGRDAKAWRDKTILKLTDDEVKDAERVQIDNANGEFVFEKKDGAWTASFAKLGKDGKPEADKELSPAPGDKKEPEKDDKKPDEKGDKKPDEKKGDPKKPDDKKADPKKPDDKKGDDKKGDDKKGDKKGEEKPEVKKNVWAGFDPTKVEELLKPFKTLSAVDFGDADLKPADSGLDDPSAQGGVIRIKLKSKEIVLKFGKTQKGKNRYFSVEGDPIVYVVSSWAADWAVGDKSKFEKSAPKPPAPGGDEGGDDDMGE
ncbi:MAG: DUF4340 domain-containing protein [Polyangiaceae bacterium]